MRNRFPGDWLKNPHKRQNYTVIYNSHHGTEKIGFIKKFITNTVKIWVDILF
jgi:hypothetical protein